MNTRAQLKTKLEAVIPVICITQVSVRPVRLHRSLRIVQELDHWQVIEKRGEISPEAQVAIVDIREVNRQDAVVASIFLRNAGFTSIIGDVTCIQPDLVRDIHGYAVDKKSKGNEIRTETLVMEDALKLYGDISDVVEYFESVYQRTK